MVEALSGHSEMYNNNYVAKDFMYLADAYIDNDAFNSFFGSSVLGMVKFYIEVFIMLFNTSGYDNIMNTEGIEKISIQGRERGLTISKSCHGTCQKSSRHPQNRRK